MQSRTTTTPWITPRTSPGIRLLSALLVAAITTVGSAQAQAPQQFSFQGKLTDSAGDPLASGTYNITFSLYDAVNAGAASWDEAQGVTVKDGLFSVQLGDINPITIPFDKPYWLGVKVESNPEMAPRTPLMSTPYSLHASSVADNSVTASKIADNAVTNSKIVDSTIDPGKIQAGADGQVLATDGGGVVQWQDKAPGMQAFVWRSAAGNISGNITVIDHPDLNNNPGAILVVSHSYDGDYVPAIGVWYSNSRNRWTIYNEDVSNFVPNEDFHVIYMK